MSPTTDASAGRKFGFTVGGAFLLLAGLAHWRGHSTSWLVFGAVAALLIGAGATMPRRLRVVERAWMGLAHLISKVTTPLFMGLIYYLVLTPIGIARRVVGANSLAHKSSTSGFWADRSDSPASPLERQF